MKRLKCVLSILLLITLIGTLVPLSAFADSLEVEYISVTTVDELMTALASASTDAENPTYIRLASDMVQSETDPAAVITVAAGTNVVIEGDGHSIVQGTVQSVSGSAEIIVNGTVVLKNITIDGNQNGRCVFVSGGGSLTLDQGAKVINGRSISSKINSGIGVYVQSYMAAAGCEGRLIINDGAEISGHIHNGLTYLVKGLAIYAGGTVIMNGGTIRNNVDNTGCVKEDKAVYGGAVYAFSSASTTNMPGWDIVNFTMNGGTIEDNYAVAGGAILCSNYSDVRLNKGTISGNTAVHAGGAIMISGTTGNNDISNRMELHIEKDMVISGNTANVGGAVFANNGDVAIIGATIENNIATVDDDVPYSLKQLSVGTCDGAGQVCSQGSGGALYVVGAQVTITDAVIRNNVAQSLVTAEDESEILYAHGNGGAIFTEGLLNLISTVTISGDTKITGNTASGQGEFSGLGGGICLSFYAGSTGLANDERLAYISQIDILGGEITGNSGKLGNDIIYRNRMPYRTSGTRVYGEIDYSYACPYLNIQGDARIGEIFLPDTETYTDEDDGTVTEYPCVIHITGELTGSIGVICENNALGTVAAVSGDDYSAGFTDARAFSYADSSVDRKFDAADGSIFLTDQVVERIDFTKAEINISSGSVSYDGTAKEPEVVVTLDGQVLSEGSAYTITYSDNTDAGTATVTAQGAGVYTGTVQARFSIVPRNLADNPDIVVEEMDSFIATGEELRPNVVVNDVINGTDVSLAADSDYSIAYESNVEAGQARVIITGCGNYQGTLNVPFTITAAPEGSVCVRSESQLQEALDQEKSYIYFGSSFSVNSPVSVNYKTEINGNSFGLTYEGETNQNNAVITVLKGGQVKIKNMKVTAGVNSRTLYVEKDGVLEVSGSVLSGRNREIDGISIYNAGTLTVEGTVVTNATYAGSAALGVVYNAGTFNMEEGTRISGGAFTYSGTVYNTEKGLFNMKGGTISGRGSSSMHLKFGAAVTNMGTFNMTGGSITGCFYAEAVLTSGIFNMKGGVIAENNATSTNGATFSSEACGGGVLVIGGTFSMYDGAVIRDNVSYMGGGVGIYGSSSVFNMYGGEIRDNLASTNDDAVKLVDNNSCGGGIGIYGGTVNMSGGSVTGNVAYIGDYDGETRWGSDEIPGSWFEYTGFGGGVYILSGCLNMTGGEISSNEGKCGPGYSYGGKGGGIVVYDDDDSTNTAARANITGGIVKDNISGCGYGADILNMVYEAPLNAEARVYVGGSAEIGELYLEDGKLMLGISGKIEDLEIENFIINGMDVVGSVAAVYEDGVESDESDPSHIGYGGQWSLALSEDGRKIILDKLSLGDIAAFAIDPVEFRGNSITRTQLTCHVTLKSGIVLDFEGMSGFVISDSKIRKDDGTYSGSDIYDSGEYTITVSAGENSSFRGSVETGLTVLRKNVEDVQIVIGDGSGQVCYDDGNAVTPEVQATLGEYKLTDDDITVEYKNNRNKGNATVTLTASADSNFEGSADFEFTIADHVFRQKASGKIAREATCSAKAEYYVVCDHCNTVSSTVTVESGELKAHTPVTVPAVEATYSDEGLTEGTMCSVCWTVIKPQEKTARLHSDGLSTELENGRYYYYVNNKIAVNITGLVTNSLGQWYVIKGIAYPDYTGIVSDGTDSWYIKKGKVNTSYSGNLIYNGKTYVITSGKVQ